MEKPTPNKTIIEKLKLYDDALFADFDIDRERWAIKRRDLTGAVHHIFFVQNEDGSYRPLDERVMIQLYECDVWKHFKDGSEFYKFFHEHNKAVELKHNTIKEEYRRWWNKEHRTEWKKALENAQRGILHIPSEQETKIYSIPS
jgi:hypothetical protein